MTILAHDYLLVRRGAERTFLAMAALFPDAPVATLLYDRAIFGDSLAGRRVFTSRWQALGLRQRAFKVLLPLMPAAAESLPVQGHAFVMSSSSAFAHGIVPDPDAVHVCYCHTPFRYAWYAGDAGRAQAPRPLRPVIDRTLAGIRRWDIAAAQRGTYYIANSRITQERIKRYWKREAPIVHPPVELERFRPGKPEDFLLIVGELVRHKQIDIALEAARIAQAHVKVVGTGTDERRLRSRYGDRTEFLGRVDDLSLADLYSRARALVVPNVEEFGITAVEAQASGRPVIAVDGGGVRETVVDGETGLLVPAGDVGALASAMGNDRLDEMESERAVANAQRFSVAAFQQALRAQLALACKSAEHGEIQFR